MKTLFIPIVGLSHRPPETRALLNTLPIDQPLILDPEPDNPYDPSAIKVSVTNDDHLVHLGYIPASGGKFDTRKCGTHEVLPILQSGSDWSATLTFSPTGTPLVKLIVQ